MRTLAPVRVRYRDNCAFDHVANRLEHSFPFSIFQCGAELLFRPHAARLRSGVRPLSAGPEPVTARKPAIGVETKT